MVLTAFAMAVAAHMFGGTLLQRASLALRRVSRHPGVVKRAKRHVVSNTNGKRLEFFLHGQEVKLPHDPVNIK